MAKDDSFAIGDWCNYPNFKAIFTNAEKDFTIYRNLKLFTVHEMMKHIRVYFIHGVSPLP